MSWFHKYVCAENILTVIIGLFMFLPLFSYIHYVQGNNQEYTITDEELEYGNWQSRVCLGDRYIYLSKNIMEDLSWKNELCYSDNLKMLIRNGVLLVTLNDKKSLYSDYLIEESW